MTITAPDHRRLNLQESVPAQRPSLPTCRLCGTDAYLAFTGFVPASYASDREGLRPSLVSYSCEHCGKHNSHETPENWSPPGWQWYA
ncbi:hypothetical protein [Arthrobacter sp. Soil736]|uniref:hypothetical protein n=1 Tax=Arthrobacter sp. Soil736 TaxID=1736395 RepID=UPI000AE9CDEF|nr:hypothetical protein [Arthrobacter sp. Soil736]